MGFAFVLVGRRRSRHRGSEPPRTFTQEFGASGMSHKARIVSLFALALVLASSQGPAQAQVVKPFKITGGGPAPDGISLIGKPDVHYATGQATELGRYSCVGMFALLGFTSESTALFSSAP